MAHLIPSRRRLLGLLRQPAAAAFGAASNSRIPQWCRRLHTGFPSGKTMARASPFACGALDRGRPCWRMEPSASACWFNTDNCKKGIVCNFSKLDLEAVLSEGKPYPVLNLVGGAWQPAAASYVVVDPLTGQDLVLAPDTQVNELAPFVASLAAVPKSGLHNPLKNIGRYVLYGKVAQKAAALLHYEEVFEFFVKCIQATMPKSRIQAWYEVFVIRCFFENFSGDSVRFAFQGKFSSGDHIGQQAQSYRWPYGPVAIITPFNFPLEIPIMQLMGALFAGNKAVIKADSRQGLPLEQFIRFLHYCGMPMEDADLLSAQDPVVSELLKQAPLRLLQFTGSSDVGRQLSNLMDGRIRLEDSGLNWKILCADVRPSDCDYLAWQSDQDAYAVSGQKCSAQSLLLVHRNWASLGFLQKIEKQAARRSLDDLTISPLFSHTSADVQNHVNALLKLKGARLLFGGSAVSGTKVPESFGLYKPTAVLVPLHLLLSDANARELATTEIFGPLQVVVEWGDGDEEAIVALTELIPHHLTAAVVSRKPETLNYFLGSTLNGTTYAGIRARTTGAPQSHFFGSAGDPRSASIGTAQAIRDTWTCHREIVQDHGPIPGNWEMPPPS